MGCGFFPGKSGLRQGDLISPLLFVLVMEYLTRVMNRMSKLLDFRYHPMFKGQQITHHTFADNLMIFCKENKASIKRIIEVIQHFSKTTSLLANSDKYNIYIAGVNAEMQRSLLDIIGFQLGALPIRYLGLPLSHRKWSKLDCQQLSIKITAKLRATSTRHLYYAGKLQIVNSVLFSMQNFWGSTLVLPQSMIKQVDVKCRRFLQG